MNWRSLGGELTGMSGISQGWRPEPKDFWAVARGHPSSPKVCTYLRNW